jgi:hypothetical protein
MTVFHPIYFEISEGCCKDFEWQTARPLPISAALLDTLRIVNQYLSGFGGSLLIRPSWGECVGVRWVVWA